MSQKTTTTRRPAAPAAAATAIDRPAASAIPDWLTETPRPASFALAAHEDREATGRVLQEVPLSPGEYEALKEHLADMRGPAKPSPASLPDVEYQLAVFSDGADKEFEALTGYEHESLTNFLRLERADRGSTTPVEEFITNLVYFWAGAAHGGRAIDPEYIRGQLAKLEDTFLDAIEDARYLHRLYPKLFEREKSKTAPAA